jgi:hypothetical protein
MMIIKMPIVFILKMGFLDLQWFHLGETQEILKRII